MSQAAYTGEWPIQGKPELSPIGTYTGITQEDKNCMLDVTDYETPCKEVFKGVS